MESSPGRAVWSQPALAQRPGVCDSQSDGAHKQPRAPVCTGKYIVDEYSEREQCMEWHRIHRRAVGERRRWLHVSPENPCRRGRHRTYGVQFSTPQLRPSDATTRSLAERSQSDGPCMSCVRQGRPVWPMAARRGLQGLPRGRVASRLGLGSRWWMKDGGDGLMAVARDALRHVFSRCCRHRLPPAYLCYAKKVTGSRCALSLSFWSQY